MAVGEMGKKAIQFGRDVAFGLRGSTVGWAEGVGIRKLQANMSKEQKDRIENLSQKAFDLAISKGKSKTAAKKAATTTKRRISESLVARDTLGYQVGNSLGSGTRGIYHGIKNKEKMNDVMKKTFTRNARDKAGKLVRDDAGNIIRELNTKAIAGTAITAGMAARIATGGGLYRDRNGDTNIPVIPFI